TKEWVCINCGFGSMTPLTHSGKLGYEPSEPDTKKRLQLLNRVAEQFGKEKVDEILKDDPGLKQVWHQSLLEDVAREFGKDKAEALVKDRPELREDWETTAQLTEEGEPYWTERKDTPGGLWYLVPILFSLLGGLVAYVVLKDRDEAMAGTCLALGCFVMCAEFFLFFLR